MQILQLCKKFPYPLKDGESIAVTYLAQGLQKLGHEITLLSMNTSKHHVAVNRIRSSLSHYKGVHYTSLDNEIKPLHAFLNLFSSDSYNISRFDNEAFRSRLITLLKSQSFDVIQLESLYLAPYIDIIRKYSTALVVLRAHNVEHEIWERMSSNEGHPLRRWYLEYSARKLKKYEIEQLGRVDCLFPISNTDAEKFVKMGYTGKLQPIPVGLDLCEFDSEMVTQEAPLSISFIGSLDWMPNVEALNWFLDQIWPHLRALFPDLVLHVAGRNCPDWIAQLDLPNVIVEGEVADSRAFLSQHPVTVVPMLSGSGMRVKILEAMALGRIVISTSLGLEGIGATDRQEVLVANTLEDFIRQFRFCYRNGKHLKTISEGARKLVESDFDHLGIARTVEESYLSEAV